MNNSRTDNEKLKFSSSDPAKIFQSTYIRVFIFNFSTLALFAPNVQSVETKFTRCCLARIQNVSGDHRSPGHYVLAYILLTNPAAVKQTKVSQRKTAQLLLACKTLVYILLHLWHWVGRMPSCTYYLCRSTSGFCVSLSKSLRHQEGRTQHYFHCLFHTHGSALNSFSCKALSMKYSGLCIAYLPL